MPKFKTAFNELIQYCREGLALPDDCQKLFFFEALEYMEVHYVPRLLVLLEGRADFSYMENGKIIYSAVDAPCFFYCSQQGYLMHHNKQNLRCLSFSYYPNYIRAMHIAFDGIHPPPTEQDIYFHSSTPLPAAGMTMLQTIQQLHDIKYDPIAEKLLKPLLELTTQHLCASQSAPVIETRPLWRQINAFIRKHRSEQLSRRQIAKYFSISPCYVSQLCKEYVGKSFSELKLSYQLEHAINLMLHTHLNIDEIAQQSGFSGANYFIRRFKKQYGITPNKYRNQQ